MAADLNGSSGRSLLTKEATRQLVLGHVAQASWHLQHALAYCPSTSPKSAEVSKIASLMTDLVRPVGRMFCFIKPYMPDDSKACYFGDELSLGLLHLRSAERCGSLAKIKLWPVSYKDLDGLISHLERVMRTVRSPIDQSAKEYASRVKKRTATPQEKRVLKSVRSAERNFESCSNANGQTGQDDVGMRTVQSTCVEVGEGLPGMP